MIELSEIDRSIYPTEREAQGEYGELLVNEFYKQKGCKVSRNPNKFGTWDTTITSASNQRSVQIKACVRFCTKDKIGLHIGPSLQAYKTIQDCDDLICVIRHPFNYTDRKYAGKIIKVKNHKQYRVSKDGNFWFPTNDETVEVIGSISDEELDILSSFETSRYQ